MTNIKVLGVVLATLGLYTWVANVIPQLESVVPEELSFTGEVTPDQLVEMRSNRQCDGTVADPGRDRKTIVRMIVLPFVVRHVRHGAWVVYACAYAAGL